MLAFANVFLPFFFFFPGLDESFDDNKTGKCCLSVHRSVSVLSLNSHFYCLFGCSARMLKRGLSAGSTWCVDATAVEANLLGLALKTVCDGSWQMCEPHSDRAMAIRHSHFGLQRRVTPNTNVAFVSTHLTKHKFVLSVASGCCQSSIQGEWCAKACLFYARAAWTQPGAAASAEGALLCPCSTLPCT